MKKIALMIFAVLILVAVGSFFYLNRNQGEAMNSNRQVVIEKPTKKDVREVVWNQLSSEQKELVGGSWQDGVVSRVTLQGLMMIGVEDKSYEDQEVYMISFDNGLNGVLALVDISSLAVIGFAPVD